MNHELKAMSTKAIRGASSITAILSWRTDPKDAIRQHVKVRMVYLLFN